MQNRTTRKPSGQPAWPLILLAGVEGGGKSWCAVEATALPIVHRAFYLELGERMADEYGSVPGADYEIVEHNGTFNDFLAATQWASRQESPEGMANMLIVDSISAVWELLSDEAQHRANTRGRGRANQDGDRQIPMDLWNDAKDRYNALMQVLRSFAGPVILTARLEFTAVVSDGKPTGEKIWKPRGHKNLPFDVQVVMQARSPRMWTLTKIASTRYQLPPGGEVEIPNFTVGSLLAQMGIDATTEVVEYVKPSPAEVPALPADVIAVMEALEARNDVHGLGELWKLCSAHNRDDLTHLIAASGQRARRAQAAQAQAPQGVVNTPPSPRGVMQAAIDVVGEVLEGELMTA